MAVAIYAQRHHLRLLRWLDILAPGLILAQAIGRMGNRINQELYGPPTSLPWAFHINPTYPCQEPAGSPQACGAPAAADRWGPPVVRDARLSPHLLLRGPWNVVGFGLAHCSPAARAQRWLRDGDIFFLYLIWYPLGRFWVEMFRPDAWRLGTLATAQWFALAGMAIGVSGLVLNHLRGRAQMKAEAAGSRS